MAALALQKKKGNKGNVIEPGDHAAAGTTIGARRNNRTPQGQTVNNHIQKATDGRAQNKNIDIRYNHDYPFC
jgi:hypothetical protein